MNDNHGINLEFNLLSAVKALAEKQFPENSIKPDGLLHRAAVKSTTYTSSNYSNFFSDADDPDADSPNITNITSNSNNHDLTSHLPMYQKRENYLE